MKQKRIAPALIAAATLGVLQCPGVFAANEYGIDYTGGEVLSASNVQVNPSLVSSLKRITYNDTTTSFSNSSKWKDGYLRFSETQCTAVKYLLVNDADHIKAADNISYEVTNSNYSAKFTIKKTAGEKLSSYLEDGKYAIVSVAKNSGYIYAGGVPYHDSTCSDSSAATNVKPLNVGTLDNGASGFVDSGARLFVETDISLTNNYSGKKVSSDNVYYVLDDIDGSQSFKILNASNKLSSSNMFVVSADDLQPTKASELSRNMFVASGNYIYSQNNFGIEKAHIYVKMDKNTLADNLNLVYGFAYPAGSGTGFFARQNTVKYISDQHGEITGIKEEKVMLDNNALGSTVKSSDGYIFDHWIASSDIKVADGSTIKAGQPISTAELTGATLTADTTFTAIHISESSIKVPNTGETTENNEAITAISLSVFGVLAGALLLRALPRLSRKKVKFE